jgi:hypothetical protein
VESLEAMGRKLELKTVFITLKHGILMEKGTLFPQQLKNNEKYATKSQFEITRHRH